jgi:hypothetical protein
VSQLIAYALRKGLEVAELCATATAFPPLDDLDGELTAITDGALGEDDKADRINALNEQLTTATAKADWAFWSNDLLQAVDGSAQKCFADCAQDIGVDTDAYHKALERYTVEVVRLIQSHHPDHTAAAKFKWMMSRPSEHHFPMMTAFVVDALINSWADLGDAISEVSQVHRRCWVSQLVRTFMAQMLDRAFAAQMLDRAFAAQMLDRAFAAQMLDRAFAAQMLDRAFAAQMLDRAFAAQMLDRAFAAQMLDRAFAAQMLVHAFAAQMLDRASAPPLRAHLSAW